MSTTNETDSISTANEMTKSLEIKIESVSLKSEVVENKKPNENDKNNKKPMNNKGKPSETNEKNKTPTTNQQIENNKKGKNKRKRPIKQQPRKDDPLEMTVNQALQSCNQGDEIKALCFVLQPNTNMLEQAFNYIKYDLMTVLHEKFPKYRIEVNAFGSTINGLAFKGIKSVIFLLVVV